MDANASNISSSMNLSVVISSDFCLNRCVTPVCWGFQVKSVNLSDSEQLSIRGVDERGASLVLANHTLLVEGQVIRSPTNTLSVSYRSAAEGSLGLFQLHYQSESSCWNSPKPVLSSRKTDAVTQSVAWIHSLDLWFIGRRLIRRLTMSRLKVCVCFGLKVPVHDGKWQGWNRRSIRLKWSTCDINHIYLTRQRKTIWINRKAEPHQRHAEARNLPQRPLRHIYSCCNGPNM